MLNVEGRHADVQEFEDAFESEHLPPGRVRELATYYHAMATTLLSLLPDGPALTRALHDLWRSKNEAVLFAVRLQRKADAS